MNRGVLFFTLVVMWLTSPAASGAAEETLAARQKGWPASLTATAGEVIVRIDGPKLWTLSRIEYGGSLLGVEESAYGTAINFRNVGFLGSAHRLDVPGRPGEVEEEQVLRLQFSADDTPWQTKPDRDAIMCESFQVERDSTIRSFSLKSLLQVRDDRIRQTVRISTERDVELKVLYPLMYAWSSSATDWLIGDDEHKVTAGKFRELPLKDSNVILQKSARWAAVYDPSVQKGSVSAVVTVPNSREHWLQFIDAPGVYRKLYLVAFSDSTVPAKFEGTFSMATGFFRAKESDWRMAAQTLAVELCRQQP